MMARIVFSHVQSGATPALRRRCVKAFSPSSTVANPLCGMTGSSGMLGRAGRMLLAASGNPPLCGPTASSFPFVGVASELGGAVIAPCLSNSEMAHHT